MKSPDKDSQSRGRVCTTLVCLGLLSAQVESLTTSSSSKATLAVGRQHQGNQAKRQTARTHAPYNLRVGQRETSQNIIVRPSRFFLSHVRRWSKNSNGDDEDDDDKNDGEDETLADKEKESKKLLENDITQKLFMSKDKAISPLSQQGDGPQNILPPLKDTKRNKQRKAPINKESQSSVGSSLLPPPPGSANASASLRKQSTTPKQEQPQQKNQSQKKSYSSLLPPPLPNLSAIDDYDGGGPFPSGLSSWEEFLGGSSSTSKQEDIPKPDLSPIKSVMPPPTDSSDNSMKEDDLFSELRSISDLFPPEFTSTSTGSSAGEGAKDPSSSKLEGVIPVSELFYRSSQSISAQESNRVSVHGEDGEDEADQMDEGDDEEGDDEELPFSAEQSDQLATDGKIKIRRNRAATSEHNKLEAEMASGKKPKRKKKKARGPKMVRRGMEMLVGGIPINADPPQRCIELSYHKQPVGADAVQDWSHFICVNSRDFGPLLHSSSIGLVSGVEKGLFCEHFVNAAMKWDVCPKDLRSIVKTHTLEQMIKDNENIANEVNLQKEAGTTESQSDLMEDVASTSSTASNMAAGLNPVDLVQFAPHNDPEGNVFVKNPESYENNILSMLKKAGADNNDKQDKSKDKRKVKEGKQPSSEGKGFGKKTKTKPQRLSREDKQLRKELESAGELKFTLGGELKFSIGVTRSELESGHGGAGGKILRRVIENGIGTAIHSELTGFDVRVVKCKLSDDGDGTTDVAVEFNMETQAPMAYNDLDRRAARINTALAQAMNDGDVQLAMAAAAREEKAWSAKVRDRVVEEFLFEDDDGDGPLYDDDSDDMLEDEEEGQTKSVGQRITEINEYDGPFGMPGSTVYSKDDIFLGGGNDGVFYDYSVSNMLNAPFKGSLGPRLVDAATQRAIQRQPRVIAIGDVHGCIDELQDLLRHCDYQPGDLVCFLGDLVSKGPDSISVVQMAREIGAIGVRGNHDFEVIRWHQAIKSGVDPPVVGSEHFHIASCLSKADMKWLYSLPWYISSKELGALFVHAGFVSGIRLAKQNPRLMMNMRSILPDGTVTSKFFNNWPWARLWDGPQTVLFGHDADRGLQQYEHAIGLDTGCVYGGRLTACILPEKRLVSVSARREYFKYRRKHYD